MAIPANVFAVDPPTIWSVASEKLPPNRALTVAPAGDVASSSTATNVALPEATGASFTAVTVMLALAVEVLNAVFPPLALVLTVLPAVPSV